MLIVDSCYQVQELTEVETYQQVQGEKSYEWTKGEELGRDTFGACFKGTDNKIKFIFAIKMVSVLCHMINTADSLCPSHCLL